MALSQLLKELHYTPTEILTEAFESIARELAESWILCAGNAEFYLTVGRTKGNSCPLSIANRR
jgi:hypothetical protein